MSDRYTIISADTHAGGSHAQYRDYLEAKYLDDFDAWRGKYRNPFKDLGDDRRLRNWDNEMRTSQQLADGIVGEVMFPNTIPPFFPSFVLSAPPPKNDEYEHRLAGIRAHNRWLADFCADYPAQRAGIGQIFTHDLDDAMADVRWIAEHGLRGGILIPNNPPDATWVEHQLYDPYWDPLWALVRRSRRPRQRARRHRRPELRQGAGRAAPLHRRVRLLRPAPVPAPPHVGRLRAPPEPDVRDDGDGRLLAPAPAAQARSLDRPDPRHRFNRRAAIRRRVDPAEGGQRVLPVELLRRRVIAEGPRRRSDVGGRVGPVHVGFRLPARRGHPSLHPRTPAAAVRRLARGPHAAFPRRQCAQPSTASTSTRWHRLAAQWGPTVDEITKPLLDLPDDANEALVRGPVG